MFKFSKIARVSHLLNNPDHQSNSTAVLQLTFYRAEFNQFVVCLLSSANKRFSHTLLYAFAVGYVIHLQFISPEKPRTKITRP